MTETENSYRRSWLALGLGSIVLMVSYGSLLSAIVSSRAEDPGATGPVFALGFGLVPIVFVVVAFVSGRSRAPAAVLKAMGVWLLIALPVGLFNPVFGLTVGFGIGGVLTLKEHETDSWKARTIAVVVAATYSFGMLFLLPALGILSSGLLALPALGLADHFTRHRARQTPPQPS